MVRFGAPESAIGHLGSVLSFPSGVWSGGVPAENVSVSVAECLWLICCRKLTPCQKTFVNGKTFPDMTYNVFSGTLNLTQSVMEKP